MKITINKSVKSSFAQVVGVGSASLSKHAVSEFESPKPLDIVLILDRTGSMLTPSPATLQNAKDAALDLLGYLNPRNESIALGALGPSDTGHDLHRRECRCLWAPVGDRRGRTGQHVDGLAVPLAAPAKDYQNANGTLNTSSQIVKSVNCLAAANRTDLGDPIAAATSLPQHLRAAGLARGGSSS